MLLRYNLLSKKLVNAAADLAKFDMFANIGLSSAGGCCSGKWSKLLTLAHFFPTRDRVCKGVLQSRRLQTFRPHVGAEW